MIMLILSTISTSIFAQNAARLNKGDTAPFTGILIDNTTVNKMRVDIQEGEINKKILLTKEILFKMSEDVLKDREKQVNILTDQNNKLSDRLYKHRSFSSWEKTTWFVIGVITTGIAVNLGRKI